MLTVQRRRDRKGAPTFMSSVLRTVPHHQPIGRNGLLVRLDSVTLPRGRVCAWDLQRQQKLDQVLLLSIGKRLLAIQARSEIMSAIHDVVRTCTEFK